MDLTVRVGDLGVPTLTRPRGREAYHRLRERWTEGSVVLVLDGVSMLSLSFLDGIVLELLAAGELDRVTFVTDDVRTEEKIGRVAGLHTEAVLYVRRPSEQERRSVVPAAVDVEDAELEPSKGTEPYPSAPPPLSARPR